LTKNSKEDSEKEATDNLPQFNLDLADAYLNLILALVSANSVFLTPTLNMLWRCIQNTDAITLEDRQLILHYNIFKTDESRESMINCQFVKNSRLHGTLSKVLSLVPKGHSEMFPLIASNFPFKLAPLAKQACYVKQCFTVLNYAPTIRQNILELCIDKCLEIDVEIRIAQDGKVKLEQARENEDSLKEDIFTMDEETETEEKRTKQEEVERAVSKTRLKDVDRVDEMAEKVR
jgi:RNA polymerase I specific transcription initiation factor RRN3.